MILKIEDQRSPKDQDQFEIDLDHPKDRSPVVILKIKIKDHDLAHLWPSIMLLKTNWEVDRSVKPKSWRYPIHNCSPLTKTPLRVS